MDIKLHESRVAVLYHKQKEEGPLLAQEIAAFLEKEGAHVYLAELFENEVRDIDCDLAVVLGGDGSILRAIRMLRRTSTPLLAINLGFLCFISGVSQQRWQWALSSLERKNQAYLDQRSLMDITVFRGDQKTVVFQEKALNELVICPQGVASIMRHTLYIGDTFWGAYRGDGVLIATSTGSTAYSLSAGGPVVDPSLDVLITTPLNPHRLNSRSLVIPAHKEIRVLIDPHQRTSIHLCIDGQETFDLMEHDSIMCSKHPDVVNLIAFHQGRNFYEIASRKFF